MAGITPKLDAELRALHARGDYVAIYARGLHDGQQKKPVEHYLQQLVALKVAEINGAVRVQIVDDGGVVPTYPM